MSGKLKMPQIASVTVAGRTVHSAKIGVMANGQKIAKLSIAVDRGFGDKKEVSFFDCTAFGKTAEFIERDCANGHGIAILIEGTLQQRRWEKDGVKRSAVEILVDRYSCLEWPDDGTAGPSPKPKTSREYIEESGVEDDIPF